MSKMVELTVIRVGASEAWGQGGNVIGLTCAGSGTTYGAPEACELAAGVEIATSARGGLAVKVTAKAVKREANFPLTTVPGRATLLRRIVRA